MHKGLYTLLMICYLAIFNVMGVTAQDSSSYTNTEIIYGRKDGMALTMLKLSPKENAKGKAIINIVSGNWVSGYSMIASFTRRSAVYISNGYTVFLVMHGSQPRYAITDETEDIRRAVRFIRYHAAAYQVDADHIGITGSSSGGHLSLMTALADDKINSTATDPVDRVSSRVQAAAVFFPPTDFMHWGNASIQVRKELMVRARVAAAFDFKKLNSAGIYESIKDDSTTEAIAKTVSPIYLVSADDPPVMIAYGDADPVVPGQQSTSIIQKLTDAHVPNKLIVKTGGSHGWRNMEEQEKEFTQWFDQWLK